MSLISRSLPAGTPSHRISFYSALSRAQPAIHLSALVLCPLVPSRLRSDTLAWSVDIAGRHARHLARAGLCFPFLFLCLCLLHLSPPISSSCTFFHFLPRSSCVYVKVSSVHITTTAAILGTVFCSFSFFIFSSLVDIALMTLRVLSSPPSLLWRGGNLVSPPPEASCHCSQSVAGSLS